MTEQIEKLRALYKAAVLATHLARVAESNAMGAQAAYNAALSQALADGCVPVGHSIDVLGDGKVKPVKECATDIAR